MLDVNLAHNPRLSLVVHILVFVLTMMATIEQKVPLFSQAGALMLPFAQLCEEELNGKDF